MGLFNRLQPQRHVASISLLDWSAYYEQGFRFVLLDVDNTLQAHGKHEITAEAVAQIRRILNCGFVVAVISNAKVSRAAQMQVALKTQGLGIKVYGNAAKPSPDRLLQACRDHGFEVEESLMIGDQVFTDIWAGRRASIYSILVKAISSAEPWYIKVKRWGERLVLKTKAET